MAHRRSPSEFSFKFFNKDCVEGMQSLKDQSIDIVVTSPPYNLGLKYKSYSDNGKRSEYLQWCLSWARIIYQKLKSNGSFFLNIGSSPSNPMLPFQIAIEFSNIFKLQNTFHWIKSISIETSDGDVVTTGHFKPINSKRFVSDCHEYVFHFTRNADVIIDRLNIGVPYKYKSNINRWKHTEGQDLRCRGNTWFIPYKTIQSRDRERPHPATFPVQLAKNCILIHGVNDNTLILDPFLGLGTSAIAAYQCGANMFIGYEIDDYYVKIAKEYVDENLNSDLKIELA